MRKGRIDGNQNEVVKAIRDSSASVAITSMLGKGFPDLVVGVNGLTLVGSFNHAEVIKALEQVKGVKVIEGASILIELKDGSKPLSARKLTPDEVVWHEKWQGSLSIVASSYEMLRLLSATDAEFTRRCIAAKLDPKSEAEVKK